MISASKFEPFTPPWLEGKDDAPVYRIRAGNVFERGNLEAELSGTHRAGRVFGFEMIDAFQQGIVNLLADDPERETLVALVLQDAAGETLAEADRQTLIRARDVLAEHWPDYAALVAQSERRRELAPILAFRRFCVGWENVAAEYRRGSDALIPMDVLATVDPLEMLAAGNYAYGLLYAAGQERNFPQPSKSDAAPETSPSAGSSKEDGTSGASAGRKTPGSRSRRGSGRSSTSG